MEKKKSVSMAVIKRLPKYHRYLKELMKNDVDRISSKELGEKIGFTASQIRQDLNHFGGFGQQGYGYNVKELTQAIENNDAENMSEELGDLLFSVVNVARFIKVNSEKALYDATLKFTQRFTKVENLCKERSIDINEAPMSVLDSLWDEVKIKE